MAKKNNFQKLFLLSALSFFEAKKQPQKKDIASIRAKKPNNEQRNKKKKSI